MKTKKIIVLGVLMVSIFIFSGFRTIEINRVFDLESLDQKGFIVYAVYDGKEDYGYNFITRGKDDAEHTLTFHKVENSVLKDFDLNSDALVKTKFKITFNREIKVSKDSDGNDDEDEINTITKLEKL